LIVELTPGEAAATFMLGVVTVPVNVGEASGALSASALLTAEVVE
jgi:hypothetical protein